MKTHRNRRHPSRRPSRLPALSALAGAALLLAACGGGGGGDDATPADGSTVDLSTRVIDGAIGNALVCLDKNANAMCDEGEPSGRSAADGSVTLKVAPEDAGKFPLAAVVGTDATDAVHGPVTSGFVLRAPGDASAAITPLSTLVTVVAESSGQTTAQADALLREQLGFGGSLLGNPMEGSDPALAIQAKDLARVLVLAQQQAVEVFKAAEGSQDSSGASITPADVTRLAHQVVVGAAQQLAAIPASEAARTASGSAELDAALKSGVHAFAAENIGTPTSQQVVAAIEGARPQSDTAAPEPAATATASLRWFTYSDAGNWYFRTFQSTAAQNVTDANGLRHFTETRKRAQGGAVQTFGETAYARTDLYWNGSQWFRCPESYEHSYEPFSATAASEALYCGVYKSQNRRVRKDIGQRPMSEVVAEIRAFTGRDGEGDYASWGPSPADPRLAGKRFPAGSTLAIYDSADNLSAPDAYRPADVVVAYRADVAAGGSSAAGAACGQVTNENSALFNVSPATLEALVAAYPGTPCVHDSTAGRNEWWSNSTIGIGNVAAPQDDPRYKDERSIRVAFAAGQVAKFYSCLLRADNSSSRNCDAAGTSTYTIETLGDAKVLRFAAAPAAAVPLAYSRIFVERGGKVYFGYHNKPRTSRSQRLDETATDALFNALGVTR